MDGLSTSSRDASEPLRGERLPLRTYGRLLSSSSTETYSIIEVKTKNSSFREFLVPKPAIFYSEDFVILALPDFHFHIYEKEIFP